MGRTWRGSQRNNRGRKWTVGGKAGLDLGRQIEARVELVLERMVRDQIIDSFTRHDPNTPKKDFTIVRGGVQKDINITASHRAWISHYERFGSEVKIIHTHPATTDSEIRDNLLQIFS